MEHLRLHDEAATDLLHARLGREPLDVVRKKDTSAEETTSVARLVGRRKFLHTLLREELLLEGTKVQPDNCCYCGGCQ